MHYRSEIDGLRALAIIPVVLFHAGVEFCSGGFLGVDIFFVISGYLITGIIVKETQENKFSVVNFLTRRARRILPPLYFMMFFVSIFYLLIARPSIEECTLFRESLLSTVSFLSNFYFAANTGYFAASSELLPFLHTWSLSVEEQFYLIYPPLLLIFLRLGKKFPIIFLLLIFFLSLGLAQMGSGILGKWNFYILPTRAWEISLGALCYFSSRDFVEIQTKKTTNEFLSFLGLGLILYSILFLDQSINAPGIWCLIPAIGTVLVIQFCKRGTMLQAILGNKVLVLIGLLSYGAYLWHQPVLAITRHFVIHPGQVPSPLISIAISISFLLALISFHLIEKPFRSGRFSLLWLSFPLIILVFLGIFSKEFSSLGINPRTESFSDTVRDLARTDYDSHRNNAGYDFGLLNKENIDLLLLGDSHARMLIPNVSKHLEARGWRGFHPYNKEIKSNFLAINQGTKEQFLSTWLVEIEELAKNAKVIVLSFRNSRSQNNYFYNTINPEQTDDFFHILEQRILQISKLSPKLIIVGPVPETPFWGPNYGRTVLQNDFKISSSMEGFKKIQQKYLKFLQEIDEENQSIRVIFPHTFLTINNHLLKWVGYQDNNENALPLYYDDDHLNSLGSTKLVGYIFKLLE
jgi:peptidoglycan/LPS O-acetylase OafA/YrhL